MNWARLGGGLVLAGVLLGQPPPSPQESAATLAVLVDQAEAKLLSVRAGEGALEDAAELVNSALEQMPGDYRALKTRARILLLERNWEEAAQAALRLNRRMPDDLEPYGLLVEAQLRIGNRKGAEEAAQWMLDLRQENPLSLWRAADVREAYEQWDGALRLLKDAYQRTPEDRQFERGLIVAQMARVSARAGHREQVERLAAEALRLAPNSAEVRGAVAEAREESGEKR